MSDNPVSSADDLDRFPSALAAIDLAGRIVAWNAAAERLTGWTRASVLQSTPTGLREALSADPHTSRTLSIRIRDTAVDIDLLVGPAMVGEGVTYLALERSRTPTGRAEILQAVASALAESLDPAEISRSMVEHAVGAMGASAGGVIVLQPDGRTLESVATAGFGSEIMEKYAVFPLGSSAPAAYTVRTGRAVWNRSAEEWSLRFPGITRAGNAQFEAAASIPLIARGTTIGALTLSFREERDFSEADRTFALTLASQCAQALDRARLYQDERRTRALAEEQRRRLEALFEAAPARIALARGPGHVYEFANSRYVEVLDDPNIVGRPAREVFPEAAEQGIVARADRVFATGEPDIVTEAPFVVDYDRDGTPEERFFNAAMLPVRDALGEIDGVMLFSVDVTDLVISRRKAERLAAEQVAILEQAAEGIAISDPKGRITFINDVGRELLGRGVPGESGEELSAAFNVFTLEGQPFPNDELPLWRALRTGEKVFDSLMVVRRPNSTEVVIQANASPILSSEGHATGAVSTFRDVTAQRELQQQKDDFLTAVSHDLRTPLTSIKGLAQLAERRASRLGSEAGEKLREEVHRIDLTATKMTGLINRLLDITRLQMNQPLPLSSARIDLLNVLRDVIAEQQVSAAGHAIVLETPDRSIVGMWDAQRIERAFANLLSNAIKYTPDGGRIVVRAERRGDSAVVSVHDPGIGIPEDALPHIFDRFYRAANIDDRMSGAGIGLAGVRQVVEQQGGTIAVESRVGGGSIFTVVLPLSFTEGAGGSTR